MSPGQMWSELRSRFSLIPQGGGRGALRSTDLVPPRGKEAGLSQGHSEPGVESRPPDTRVCRPLSPTGPTPFVQVNISPHQRCVLKLWGGWLWHTYSYFQPASTQPQPSKGVPGPPPAPLSHGCDLIPLNHCLSLLDMDAYMNAHMCVHTRVHRHPRKLSLSSRPAQHSLIRVAGSSVCRTPETNADH